jgi:hypothetical protein
MRGSDHARVRLRDRGQQGIRQYAWLTNHLNEMAQQGGRLHTIFEQDKNTVIVFERPTP